MKVWGISREECEMVTQMSLVSARMRKARCGSRKDWLCQREKL
jgi:hypothetical protein